MLRFAHRVNTIEYLRHISTSFFQGIECDVFLLNDNTVAVIHHKDYGMTAQEIENTTLEQLHKNTRSNIPELSDMLDALLHTPLIGYIEIKGSNPDQATQNARRVVHILRKKKIEPYKITLHSFSIEALRTAQQIAPEYNSTLGWPSSLTWAQNDPCSKTTLHHLAHIQRKSYRSIIALSEAEFQNGALAVARSYNFHSVALHFNHLTKKRVHEIHAADVLVYSYLGTHYRHISRTAKKADALVLESKLSLSSFAQKVLTVVALIPKGKVMSYSMVAQKAGYPGAARAVGTLMKNNFDLSIPCHRVINANGSIGAYNRGGTQRKIELLRAEGAINT